MDVAISILRAEISAWIEKVQSGEEVVVTDRGVPVARLTRIDTAPLLERLSRQGVLTKPRNSQRPAAKEIVRAQASGPVADLIADQRR